MDLDDDLLALVGDSAPAAASASASAAPSPPPESGNNKRKRDRDESGSDMEESDSSDDDDEDRQRPRTSHDDFVSPFPYQTLFKDKADKAYIMGLNEVERESILAERQDEVQKQKDRIQVRRMATQLSGAPGAGAADDPSAAAAAAAAAATAADRASGLIRGKSERKKTQTGKSESKSSKLDELKRKRESKKRREAGAYDSDEEYGVKPSSSSAPTRRRSPQFSDDEEDDDNNSARGSESDDFGRKPSAKRAAAAGKKGKAQDEFADELTIRGLFLQRRQCMDHWTKPWFLDLVKNAYVRVLVGPDPENPGENKYRLAVVSDVVTPFTAAELQAREQEVEKVAAEAAEDANSDMEASDSDEGGTGGKGHKKKPPSGPKNAAQKKLEQVQADLAREKKRRAFQPYKMETGELCDVMLEAKHGSAAKLFALTELSNQPFNRREYQRLLSVLNADNLKVPLKDDAESKAQTIKRLLQSVRSEADIDAAIRKKKLLNDPKHVIFIKTMCRDATSDERQRQRFEADIQKLSSRLPASATISTPVSAPTTAAAAADGTPGTPTKRSLTDDASRQSSNTLAALSERNRKANREEIRRAEIEARRKSQNASKVDPSARVRTTVKVLHDMSASTPDPNQIVSFEAPTNATDSQAAQLQAVVTENMNRSKTGPTKLESRAQEIDVDLGDF